MLSDRNCGRAGEAAAPAILAVAADERGEKGELLAASVVVEADDEERGDNIVAVAVAERMCDDEDDDDAEEEEERSGVEETPAEAAPAAGAAIGVVPKERLPRTKLSRPSASVFSSVFSRKLSKLASCAEDAEARTEAEAVEDEDAGAATLWALLPPPVRSRGTAADGGRLLPLRLPFERDMVEVQGARHGSAEGQAREEDAAGALSHT
jgi:hypothetical protein